MQNGTGNGKLKIHTVIEPQACDTAGKRQAPWWRAPFTPFWAHTAPARAKLKRSAKPVRRRARARRTLSASEKLLRNSAVACALLLGVMALQNVNQPWTQAAFNGIRDAVTMDINLDDTLGKLNFVRSLVPDAALVFWNMNESSLSAPVNGTITHAYDDMQPWTEYACAGAQSVCAAEYGTVAAVGQSKEGDWTLLIDHADGAQTVYAYLAQVLVSPGQSVEKGAQVGVTADSDTSRLYFELRKNGVPANPATYHA